MTAPIRFDTANMWWLVQLDRQNHQTTATVTGQSHAVARPVVVGRKIEPGRYERFTVTESDQDVLFDRVRAKIKELDGPILKTDS